MSREAGNHAVAPDGSPVDLYLVLPGDDEAAFIHRNVPAGAAILELGCGAGRVTRHLVALGHSVVAVDNSAAMLDHVSLLPDVEAVLSDIETLELSPRRWPVVLLASHLINTEHGPSILAAAARHCAADGEILVQRHEPGWVDSVEESTSRRPGLTIDMVNITHPRRGFLRAEMVYDIDSRRSRQTFDAYEVDDRRLAELAASVGCDVVEVLGIHRKWIRLRPRQSR
jgi:SAM-dependent methyltransferase